MWIYAFFFFFLEGDHIADAAFKGPLVLRQTKEEDLGDGGLSGRK